jgi:hypothetical protein
MHNEEVKQSVFRSLPRPLSLSFSFSLSFSLSLSLSRKSHSLLSLSCSLSLSHITFAFRVVDKSVAQDEVEGLSSERASSEQGTSLGVRARSTK